MPALHLFHRRTIFAGDDLQPSSILTCIAHIGQFFILVLPIFIHLNYETTFILSLMMNDTNNNNNGNNIDNDKEEDERLWIGDLILHYLFGYGDLFDHVNDNNNNNNINNDELKCYPQNANYFSLFLFLFLLTSTIHIITNISLESIIYSISYQGHPTQPERRICNHRLSYIIEHKWIWSSIVGNILLVTLGIMALIQGEYYFTCRQLLLLSNNDNNNNDNDPGMDYYNDTNAYNDTMSTWFGRHAWWIACILLLSSQAIQCIVSIVALHALLRQDKVTFDNGDVVVVVDDVGDDDNHNLRQDFNDNNDDDAFHSNPHSNYQHHHNHHHHHHHHELVEEMWDQRCKSFCKCAASSTCYLFGGRDLVDGAVGDYGPVSRALADYFEDGGVLDVVVSDIAVGFMMLQRRQRQRVLAARKDIIHYDLIQHEKRDVGYNVQVPIPALRRDSAASTSSGNLSATNSNNDLSSAIPPNRLSFDSHNFGHGERKGERIHSILHDEMGHEKFFSQLGEIPQYNNQESLGNDTLLSISQPMPYTSTLLLPKQLTTSGNATTDFLNTPTAAWSLRKTSVDGGEMNYVAQQRRVFNRNDAIDTNIIAEGARFARHALSIYTWYLYVYMKPLAGTTNLIYNRISEFCKQCKKNSMSGSHPTQGCIVNCNSDELIDNGDENNTLFGHTSHGQTFGDNFLHIHTNSLLAQSGLDKADLIYANFNNKYNQMPYCIVIDHRWQSVVLSIRGTLSLEDCLVDVLVEPDPLEDFGRENHFNAEGEYCHSGVLSCVKYILNDLKRHGVIPSLLTGAGAPYSHYTLRLTGHSLGAGCATLLGYVMRREYPNLRVVAISPPAVFTKKLATECKDFTTSFVLDSDLVPRLTVQNMESLRDEILEMISRIKVPKMQVIRAFLLNGIFQSHNESNDPETLKTENDEILLSKEDIPTDTEFYHQMLKFKEIQEARKAQRGDYRTINLYPPGKMVHLVKIDERRTFMNHLLKCITCCTTNSGYKYTPVYVDNDDFDEISISPTMGFDHFPNRVCLELERVAEVFGIDTSLGSSARDHEHAERVRNDTTSIF